MTQQNAPARPNVDISQATEDARRASEQATPEDGPYGELMATYVELGELLDTYRTDPEFEDECRELVERLIALGKARDEFNDQQTAVWMANHTTFGEEPPGGRY